MDGLAWNAFAYTFSLLLFLSTPPLLNSLDIIIHPHLYIYTSPFIIPNQTKVAFRGTPLADKRKAITTSMFQFPVFSLLLLNQQVKIIAVWNA